MLTSAGNRYGPVCRYCVKTVERVQLIVGTEAYLELYCVQISTAHLVRRECSLMQRVARSLCVN